MDARSYDAHQLILIMHEYQLDLILILQIWVFLLFSLAFLGVCIFVVMIGCVRDEAPLLEMFTVGEIFAIICALEMVIYGF